MITSIPKDIAVSVMLPGFTKNTACLLDTVKQKVGSMYAADYRALEWETESVRLALSENFNVK